MTAILGWMIFIFVMALCAIAAIGVYLVLRPIAVAAWEMFAAWRAGRSSRRTPDRSDYLEMLEAIDAEILDLYDERADVVQALRKLDTTGRA